MLRTAVKASSVFRRISISTSTVRQTLLNPAISPAVGAVPHHPNLATQLSQTSLLFFPAILGQLRGHASGRRAPDDDDDISDGELDSEDFKIGGEDFAGDDEEGMTDEDFVDEDAVEDESD